MRTINVGIIGLGTVGGGTARILIDHHDAILRHQGVDIHIAGVASLKREEAEALGLEDVFHPDGMELIADPDIDIIVELIGGTGFAKTIVIEALKAGKYVVTANKALMASSGEEVFAAAEASGTAILFEAAVGGGIPIIGPLKDSLMGNEISQILGIVNGTTNYMLTRMSAEGMDYGEALKEAQANGYAEADPTADVEGFDAAAKIAILGSIAFNSRITIDQVPTEGISKLTAADIEAADAMGYTIKLLAIANRCADGIDIRVHPTMLRKAHPLASVNDVFNAIYVVGDYVGETMFFGKGAGSGPAASAVVGNVIELARDLNAEIPVISGCTCTDAVTLRPMEQLSTRYYLRIPVLDRPGVFAKIAESFAAHNVSIFSVVQRGGMDASRGTEGADNVNLVVVTHAALEADMRATLADIAQTNVTAGEPTLIRVI